MEALSKQAVRVLKLFGSKAERVITTCGRAGVNSDRQLLLSVTPRSHQRRTDAVRRDAAEGQELEDQCFGAIPSRVMAFMSDVEAELYKVGVPVKTRHNEVAPSQCRSRRSSKTPTSPPTIR
jgi:glutamine synthetase